MKKVRYLFLVLCLMFVSVINVSAVDIDSLEEVNKFNIVTGDNLDESKKVDGSSIVAGDNVTVSNAIKGIDMVFGNNITYKNNSDYSLVAGNVVNISGTTENDGFIFGNVVTFDESYSSSRDLFVAASSVTLKGEITRDVKIYASTVVLENVKIAGNVTIYASSIEIKDDVEINTLSYNEDAEINISEKSVITSKEEITTETSKESIVDVILDNIINYASILVVFLALALLLPNIFKKIEAKTEDISISKFISMLGYGLFFLIIIPIIFVMLLMIVIGIPLALLTLALYIITILLSTIFAGYFIGLIIWKKFIKKEVNILLVGLIGISIIKVLSFIPVIGVLDVIVSILLSLSIVAKLFTKDA
jgi:hypothetical protein